LIVSHKTDCAATFHGAAASASATSPIRANGHVTASYIVRQGASVNLRTNERSAISAGKRRVRS
jgi:hypothetical protein